MANGCRAPAMGDLLASLDKRKIEAELIKPR
jgi:hypothetical protein